MKKYKYILIGSALIGIIYLINQYNNFKNFVLKVDKIKFNTVSLKKLDFILFLNFYNKSDIKVNITAIKYIIYLNNYKVSEFNSNYENEILPNQYNNIELPIIIKPNELIKTIGNKILGILTKGEIQLKIEIIFDCNLYGARFPVKTEYIKNLTV